MMKNFLKIVLIFSILSSSIYAMDKLRDYKKSAYKYVHKETGEVYNPREKRLHKMVLATKYNYIPAKLIHKKSGKLANGELLDDKRPFKKVVVTFKDGIQHGPRKSYYRKSEIVEKIDYYENGKVSDRKELYRKDGTLKTKRWKDNKKYLYNYQEEYDKAGNLLAKIQWDHRSLQEYSYANYPNGNKKIEISINSKNLDKPYFDGKFYDSKGNTHSVTPDMIDTMFEGESQKIDDSWLKDLSLEELLKKGMNSYKRSKHLRAILYYTMALDKEPNNIQAYYYRAINYQLIKQSKRAIIDYAKIIELNPNLERVYSGKAFSHYYIKEYKEAYENFIKAESLIGTKEYEWMGKKNTLAYMYFPKAAYNTKNYDKALEISTKKLQKSPHSYSALLVSAKIYKKRKEYDRALEFYKKILVNNKKDDKTYRAIGYIYEKKEDYKSALSHYQKAVKIKTTRANKNTLAWFYATAKDKSFRDGKKAVKIALEVIKSKDLIMYQDTLGAAYVENKQYDKAIDSYNKVMKKKNKYIKTYQGYLKDSGYYKGEVDGVMNDEFSNAMKKFIFDGYYMGEKISNKPKKSSNSGDEIIFLD